MCFTGKPLVPDILMDDFIAAVNCIWLDARKNVTALKGLIFSLNKECGDRYTRPGAAALETVWLLCLRLPS